jgi:hypothetical protein
MAPAERHLPKAELFHRLRFAGFPEETIGELDAVLPDPVDFDRDGDILARHGITRDELISRRGGSP